MQEQCIHTFHLHLTCMSFHLTDKLSFRDCFFVLDKDISRQQRLGTQDYCLRRFVFLVLFITTQYKHCTGLIRYIIFLSFFPVKNRRCK